MVTLTRVQSPLTQTSDQKKIIGTHPVSTKHALTFFQKGGRCPPGPPARERREITSRRSLVPRVARSWLRRFFYAENKVRRRKARRGASSSSYLAAGPHDELFCDGLCFLRKKTGQPEIQEITSRRSLVKKGVVIYERATRGTSERCEDNDRFLEVAGQRSKVWRT